MPSVPPRRLRAPAALFGLVALAGLAVSCRDEAGPDAAAEPPPPPTAPGDPPVVQGTPSAAPSAPKPAAAVDPEEKVRAAREEMDRQAHRHLEVFRGLVYDPWRDAGLRAATCTVEIDVDGRKGSYRVVFDGSKKDGSREDDRQTTLEVLREDPDLHGDAAKQAKRFALVGLRGAYSSVLSYTPPLQYQCYKAADGHVLVVAPPFKTAVGVTYRCDLRGLVEMSGATDGKDRVRTVFHWEERSGKYLLRRATEEGGKAVTEYVHTDVEGIPFVTRASIVEGVHACVAELTWSGVVRE